MAIHIGWQDAARSILVWSFEGSWGWDEFNRHMIACHAEAQALGHRYDSISDMSRCYLLPPGVVARAHLALKYAPHNLGTIVVVGLPTIFDASLRALRRVHPRLAGDLHTASTMDEALAVIERQRNNPTRADALAAASSRMLTVKKITGLLKAAC